MPCKKYKKVKQESEGRGGKTNLFLYLCACYSPPLYYCGLLLMGCDDRIVRCNALCKLLSAIILSDKYRTFQNGCGPILCHLYNDRPYTFILKGGPSN